MIIGISGQIGSGKDAVTKKIIETFPEMNFKSYAFGYNVKKVVSLLTGVNLKVVLSRQGKLIYLSKWGMTIGEMFQKLASDAIREKFHEDAWIISLFNNLKNDENIIITDVRFLNEAEYILNRGGYLIRLVGDPKNINKTDERDNNHYSETELDNFNKFDIIYNNIPPINNLNKLIMIIKKKLF